MKQRQLLHVITFLLRQKNTHDPTRHNNVSFDTGFVSLALLLRFVSATAVTQSYAQVVFRSKTGSIESSLVKRKKFNFKRSSGFYLALPALRNGFLLKIFLLATAGIVRNNFG